MFVLDERYEKTVHHLKMTYDVHKKQSNRLLYTRYYSLLRAKRFLQIEHFGQSPLLPLLALSITMLLMELVEPTSWQNCDGDDCSSADELSLLSIICDAEIIRCELMMNGYERLMKETAAFSQSYGIHNTIPSHKRL